ncbi:MAG: hypothetical protein ACLTDD_09090 [Thomasclavelia spiroformis]
MKCKVVYIILVILGCLFIGKTLIDYERTIDQQKNHIKLLQEELKEIQGDSEYYKSQYKKYYELSEELQNQIGVYSN